MNAKTLKYLRWLARQTIKGNEVTANELNNTELYPEKYVRRALKLAERRLRRRGH